MKEFDNKRYRQMKKVFMEPEEQSTINTNTNQSNELLTIDTDNSINMRNEIFVRKMSKEFLFKKKKIYCRMIKH